MGGGFLNRLEKTVSGDWQSKPDQKDPYLSLVHAIETIDGVSEKNDRLGGLPVHVSSAINFCARQNYLITQTGRLPNRYVSTADRLLWAFGKAAEAHMKLALRQAYGNESVYAKWTCLCGERVQYGLGKNPYNVVCDRCKTNVVHQCEEIELRHTDLLIGRPDLLLLRGGKLQVIEMKSIKSDDFKTLTTVSLGYKMQAYGYLKLLEQNKDRFLESGIEVDVEKFYVLFASKGYLFRGSVLKEFEIKVSDLPQSFKDEFDLILDEIRLAKDNETIPKRTRCSSVDCPMAKDCSVASECFSYDG